MTNSALINGPIVLPNTKVNTLIIDRNPIQFCKCGNEPYIGAEFYYKSRYNTEPTIGTIFKIYPSSIISANGTTYKKDEIEVKPLHIAREEKLNELGI